MLAGVPVVFVASKEFHGEHGNAAPDMEPALGMSDALCRGAHGTPQGRLLLCVALPPASAKTQLVVALGW